MGSGISLAKKIDLHKEMYKETDILRKFKPLCIDFFGGNKICFEVVTMRECHSTIAGIKEKTMLS